MTLKINPALITDDMMYEKIDLNAYDYVDEMDKIRVNERMQGLKEDKLWGEIRRAAKKNTTLQAALDHAIMIYKLSKEYNNGL